MMISIGHKHFIESDYIVEILKRTDTGADRHIHAAAASGMLIDATGGKRIRSIVRLKSKHIVLSALKVEILQSKIKSPTLFSAPGDSNSKQPEFADRRRESERRHFSYTHHIPERRNGSERRDKNGRFRHERKNE